MKICHVTSAHDTNDVRIFKKECVSLAKKSEHEVFLVGPGESRTEKGVTVIGVGRKPSGRFDRMAKFAPRVLESAIRVDADIYHLHDPELIRFAVKLKKLGKKVVFDSHENVLESIDDKTYMPVILRKCAKLYYSKLQKYVLKRIDAVVVVTPQMIDTYKLFNDNVVMITNYPIIDMESLSDSDNGNYKRGTFVFAGGISEQWSHKEIVQAIEDIDDVEYRLFGPVDETYFNELQSLAGWEKVHYGGKIPYEQVQKEIENAHGVFALLKPSKNTFYNLGTLGNTKLFEAFSNGKPVIATDFELWRDIVVDNKCGVCVNPGDVSQIKSAIQSILNIDENEYKAISVEGKRIIKENYNWNVCEEVLFDLYRDICNKGDQ